MSRDCPNGDKKEGGLTLGKDWMDTIQKFSHDFCFANFRFPNY